MKAIFLFFCLVVLGVAYENPAAAYCNALGFDFEISKDSVGNEIDECILPDATRLDAWKFMRGEAGEEYSYCSKMNMQTKSITRTHDGYKTQVAVCESINKKGVLEQTDMLELMRNNGDLVIKSKKKLSTEYLPVTQKTLKNYSKKSYPASLDWRNYNGKSYIGPVRSQGMCGSCYAFGAVAAAEGSYNLAYGLSDSKNIDFSEAYIAFCLGSNGPYGDGIGGSGNFDGCDGADYDYAELEALTIEGVTLEENLPYSDDPNDFLDCDYTAFETTIFKQWGRVPSNDVNGIQHVLSTYGVIDAAVYVTDDFEAYTGGIFSDSAVSCDYGAYTTVNHAIALVGWGTDETHGLYWILRNSWGSGWGEDGYMRIAAHASRVSCAATYLESFPKATSPVNPSVLTYLLN